LANSFENDGWVTAPKLPMSLFPQLKRESSRGAVTLLAVNSVTKNVDLETEPPTRVQVEALLFDGFDPATCENDEAALKSTNDMYRSIERLKPGTEDAWNLVKDAGRRLVAQFVVVSKDKACRLAAESYFDGYNLNSARLDPCTNQYGWLFETQLIKRYAVFFFFYETVLY